ncbi:MAG: SLAC1 anion channel family protein [Burkholderiales bacterium]|nr:SLAC1 anion channel family protein [Burkholderiales bacterium]
MSETPAAPPSPLKFLAPGWFTIVMGLSGLALAWTAAVPRMGAPAQYVAWSTGAVAALVFIALVVLFVQREQLHPEALSEDLRHPVRHVFVAALPVSLILLATLGAALSGAAVPWLVLWLLGCVLQLAVTLWVLSRWWRGGNAGGFQWPGITPVLIIPVVGNVLTPLAGIALGEPGWAAAQFGLGVFLWPVVIALLFVRIGVQGLWPERLLPTGFITVAPPAVIGLALLPLGAGPAWSQACWGIALFFLLWAAQVMRTVLAQPFSMAWWALSFPLAAFAALTLRLAPTGQPFAFLAVPLLALATLVIAWLCLQTLRGLRRGTLLVAEG